MFYNNKDNQLEKIDLNWFLEKSGIANNVKENCRVDLNNTVQALDCLKLEDKKNKKKKLVINNQ